MPTLVTIEVFIVFVIAAFIFGGVASLFILGIAIAVDKKEDKNKKGENDYDGK